MNYIKTVLLSILIIFINQPNCSAQLNILSIQCEKRDNPMGISTKNFHFSWEMNSLSFNDTQSNYQVGIASSSEKLQANLFDVWDSGKIKSANSTWVKYLGKPLNSATKYFWKVRVWNKFNKASKWSQNALFCTGIENPGDWKNAKWIGYEDLADSMRVVPGIHLPKAKLLKNKALQRPITPLIRKNFNINKKVINVLAFISGLGHYVLSVNGKNASNAFLAPGWTYYDKTSQYTVLDITSLINKGNNTLGVILGNGFYNINRERYFKLTNAFGMPKLLSRIKISYADGSVEDVVTDNTWKTAPSPIVFNSIFSGEDYDARMEQKKWDMPNFNDDHWKEVELVTPPAGKLVADMDYPLAVMDTFKVQKITEVKPLTFLYDFGQNASGIVEIKVRGQKGQTIKLIPSEILTEDNLANQRASGQPYYFLYTLKGDGLETWRPNFTYYGFRYVQVEGAKPQGHKDSNLAELMEMKFLHTRNSAPSQGNFECSNKLFNQIYSLINWAIKSNFQSVITDCPHREKLGWLEQDYLMGKSIQYNFANYRLYHKLVDDMMDAQTAEGLVPDIAPEYVKFEKGFLDSPEWGSACVILPWQLYTWYGDEAILAKAYPMMKKYVAYLEGKSNKHILSYGLGDWFDYGPKKPGEAQLTPKDLTATAIYYHDVNLLSKIAKVLNLPKDALKYAKNAEAIKEAFNLKFFDQKKGVYSTGSQTAMAMPLSIGLVAEPYKSLVLKNLCDSIISTGYKLTAGDIGFHFLVDALDKGGKSDIIYQMNNRDNVPGYGYQIKKGATALTESWPALTNVSNNHLMLGHVMEWFYSGLLGIDQEEGSIGFKTLRIKPQPVGDITSAKGSFHTPYGWVKISWKKDGVKFLLNITVPVNSSANIYLPIEKNLSVFEHGKLIKTQIKESSAMINRGSGNYVFEVK